MQTVLWQQPAPLVHHFGATRRRRGSFTSHLQRSGTAESGLSCRSRAGVSPPGACGRSDLQPEASTSGRNVWQSTQSSRHPIFTSNRTQTAAASASADASTDAASGLPEIPLPNLPVRGKGLGSLALRSIFGTILGLIGAVVITAGGWLFTGAVCLVAYQATQEFFGFVTCKGIAEGQSPPSPIVSALTTAMCLGLSIWTHITHGRATAALAVASFAVLAVHVSLTEKPTTAQLASAVFGLFYCGYLPSFWVKLRLLSAPAVHSHVVHDWPVLFGGLSHWTVGLVATFMAVACVIAADTGAYFCGRSFGRTQLTRISPKKTVEGAVGGLICSIATAVGFWQVLAWPVSLGASISLGTLVFFASLFGDLIESVMKRDAGLKDASNLIPGHGGLLDRFDSYLFTGAIVYFVIKFVMPFFGL
ncbi:hypothetical protein ABBQ38_000976 [Trebouxia sp. C0009 RCD-2024]